jgi:hypothetical protein
MRYADWEQRYNELADAVREMATNPELLKIVGPSQEELAEAASRIRTLDRISPLCQWDLPYPSTINATTARHNWKRISDEQDAYEARYH